MLICFTAPNLYHVKMFHFFSSEPHQSVSLFITEPRATVSLFLTWTTSICFTVPHKHNVNLFHCLLSESYQTVSLLLTLTMSICFLAPYLNYVNLFHFSFFICNISNCSTVPYLYHGKLFHCSLPETCNYVSLFSTWTMSITLSVSLLFTWTMSICFTSPYVNHVSCQTVSLLLTWTMSICFTVLNLNHVNLFHCSLPLHVKLFHCTLPEPCQSVSLPVSCRPAYVPADQLVCEVSHWMDLVAPVAGQSSAVKVGHRSHVCRTKSKVQLQRSITCTLFIEQS